MLPKLHVPKIIPEHTLQAMSEIYDWGMYDLKIPDAHQITMGEGIKIAVLDSGKSEHFDVADNVIGARNFTDSSTLSDKTGHATFVSGIIAAVKNDEGIIGVAPKAKICFGKTLDDSGAGGPSNLVRSIKWSMKQQVDIISISAGMFFDFKPLHKVVQQAYNRNVIIVAATGNSGTRNYDVAFPARYPEVIGVAAYDKQRHVAKFSSRGTNVMCAMPGVNIYSTWLNNQFCKNNGTSFAAPYLSGICALILAKHRKNPNSQTPCKTPRQMMDHLQKYSVKLDEAKATGFGTIDLNSLLTRGI